MNPNLPEYHVPVCADIQDFEVIFLPEHGDTVNPLGVKRLGENRAGQRGCRPLECP